MIKQKYIDEVLNQDWKFIENEEPVLSIEWSDDKESFRVETDDQVKMLDFDEFFNHCVIKSNERYWVSKSHMESRQKHLCGWLCVMNAMSIFSKYEDVDPTKETSVISGYVKDRLDDAHFTIKNNLLPPWLGEKVDMNFIY